MARSDEEDPDDEFFKRVYGDGYKPQTREEKEEEERGRERERERERELRKRGRERERDRAGEEDEGAMPRDFRSKYSRAWDDRAKAVERHYTRRREEDLTCRSCGEKGHPTQGCPQSLGSGRRSAGAPPFTMLINDRRLRARLIGTGGAVIQGLEKESGCRIRLEDNPAAGAPEGSFVVRVMGGDRESVEKGEKVMRDMVARVEEELKNRPTRPPPALAEGPGQPSAYGPGAPVPGLMPMPGHAYLVPHTGHHPLGAMHPYAASPAQWEAHAAQYYYTANGAPGPDDASAQEEKGMEDMEVGYEEAKAARGASPLAEPRARLQGSSAGGGGPHPHTCTPASAARPDASKVPGTLEELESLAGKESADLEAAQSKDEEEEHERHLERLAEIAAAYHEKRAALGERQAQRRRTFFRLQSLTVNKEEAEQASPIKDVRGRGMGSSRAVAPATTFGGTQHEHMAQPLVSQPATVTAAADTGMPTPYMHYRDQPFDEPAWAVGGGTAQAPGSHWQSYASPVPATAGTEYNASLSVPMMHGHVTAPYVHSYILPQ